MSARRDRPLGTWCEVAGLVGGLVLLVASIERLLVPAVAETWLRVVLALAGAELLLIAAGIGVAVACKLWGTMRAARRARLRPAVQAALAAQLAGHGDVTALVRLARRHRALVEACLEECLRTVRGEPHAAAVRLVGALGLLGRWRRAARAWRAARREAALARLALLPAGWRNDVMIRALGDRDEGVRRAAVRGLVPTADTAAVGEAVRLTAVRSLTERALLVDELRRHAGCLATEVFARALGSDDEATVVATLEMVRACGRVLPIPALAALLGDPRAAVRAAAIATVPYAVGGVALADAVAERLADDDADVRVAAAGALGTVRAHAALAALARGLRSSEPRLAVASAHALAALGAPGLRRLEAAVLHGSGWAPLAAAEALGQAIAGRRVGEVA